MGSGVTDGREQGQGFITSSTQGHEAGPPQQQYDGQVQPEFGGVRGVTSDSTRSPVPSTFTASDQQPPITELGRHLYLEEVY